MWYYVGDASYAAGLKHCALSTRLFIAHCFGSRNPRGRIQEVVTYHTSCVAGVPEKIRRMRSFMKVVQSGRDIAIGSN